LRDSNSQRGRWEKKIIGRKGLENKILDQFKKNIVEKKLRGEQKIARGGET